MKAAFERVVVTWLKLNRFFFVPLRFLVGINRHTRASPAFGVIDVFVRSGDNRLWQKTDNGGWYGWTSIGGM